MKRFYIFVAFLALFAAAQAQTDMTASIVNPSFEDDWTGWEYDGLARQGNDAFQLKAGNTYVEKWTGTGGQVGNASLYQTLTNLPAGTYTLTCVAQNIQQDKPTAKQTGVTLQANSQKTKVTVADTYSVQATIADGTLRIGFVLQSASGNYVCVDDFHLTLEEPTAETFAALHEQMQKVVDSAKAINQQTGTKEQQELDAAREAVEALIGQDTAEGVTEAVLRLNTAIDDYRLSIASPENPYDMTSHIYNPSFEKKGTDGWTVSGMAAQGNDAFKIKKGSTYVEAWTWSGNHIHDCSISQLVNFPNGRYTLTAAAQNFQENNQSQKQTGAWLFAGDYKADVNATKVYELEFVVIENQINIGFMTRGATGNWVAVDNFTATYLGRDEATLLGVLAERTARAEALTADRQNSTVLANLQAAIASAKALATSEGMAPVATTLRECMEATESSIAAYADLARAIEASETLYGEGSGQGADAFRAAIDAAKQTYADDTKQEAELSAAVAALAKADLAYNMANATGEVPEVHTSEFIARGATGALGRSTVSGTEILEQGFCWATHPNPTLDDAHSSYNYNINGPMYLMQPLEPATVYYVRAYAMSTGYQVGYGEVRKIITVPKGTCGWWYNYGADPEANARIAAALEDCIYYYNNWSGIQGFHISCSFGSGTPTADCGYGGGMRVGPNPAYQRTGTILHESNHGVGVGTSGRWWDGNLHDGVWKGRRANTVLQFIENNPTAMMAGDSMHMWPYGINGAGEDNGWAMTYIANVLITYAMHEDGLVPPGKNGGTPAYTFPCEDGQKYYIASEQTDGAYLYDAGTTMKWETANLEQLRADDSYAWYLEFSPAKLYYRLRNAKSGKYMSYASGTLKLAAKDAPANTEYIQLMASREDLVYKTNQGNVTTCSYWVMAGQDAFEPQTLTIGTNHTVKSTTFNISDAAKQQRWFFLTADDIDTMDNALLNIEKDKLRLLVEGAKAMLDVPHDDIAQDATPELAAVAAQAESILQNSVDAQEITSQCPIVTQAVKAFITGTYTTGEQPYTVTFLMTNPTLKDNAEGWTTAQTPTQREGICEYFNTAYDLKQTIPDMPAGRYEFRLQGFERPGPCATAYKDWAKGNNKVKAYIYYKSVAHKTKLKHAMDDAQPAKLGTGVEELVGDLWMPNDMRGASKYFACGLYDNALLFEHEQAGKMLLGLKNTQSLSEDWTPFVNFRLLSFGNPEAVGIDAPSAAPLRPARPLVHDLSGRPVQRPTRGLYIVGGQKVMIR